MTILVVGINLTVKITDDLLSHRQADTETALGLVSGIFAVEALKEFRVIDVRTSCVGVADDEGRMALIFERQADSSSLVTVFLGVIQQNMDEFRVVIMVNLGEDIILDIYLVLELAGLTD